MASHSAVAHNPSAAFVSGTLGSPIPSPPRVPASELARQVVPPGDSQVFGERMCGAVAALSAAVFGVVASRTKTVAKRAVSARATSGQCSAMPVAKPTEWTQGRVAMVAGMGAQDGLASQGCVACVASPLRAFENEVGAIPPLGFFDPLGFSRDGDIEEFCRRREAELKNGRVAMYATLGYIVPEYWRVPGFLSPSLDIKFEDVPNGIYALEKVPVEGWLQIIAWCGFFELCVNYPPHPTEPGNYYKGRFGVFWNKIIKDPVQRREALNKEVANGRLAMIAILAMFFQNGVVGNTGPAMWYGQ